MSKIKKIKINKANTLYFYKTKKFKSINIGVSFIRKYKYEDISFYDTLGNYLSNCNSKYPFMESFNKHIDDLYGLDFGITKNYGGNHSAFIVNVKFVHPKYVSDDNLLDNVLDFLYDCLFRPLIVDNKFDKSLVDIFKNASLINAKSSKDYNMGYLINKLYLDAYKNKKCAATTLYRGDEKIIKTIDEENLYDFYKKVISSKMEIKVTGNIAEKVIVEKIKDRFNLNYESKFKKNLFEVIPQNKEHKPIIIRKNVSQASVAVLYQTPILFNDERYFAFKLLNCILSMGLTSKFMANIREKMGLCYSINARYQRFEGLYFITSYTSMENIKALIDELANQIKQVSLGNISDEEIKNVKQLFLNNLSSMDDTPTGMMNYLLPFYELKKKWTIEDISNIYNNVTKQEIIDACRTLTYVNHAILVGDDYD